MNKGINIITAFRLYIFIFIWEGLVLCRYIQIYPVFTV